MADLVTVKLEGLAPLVQKLKQLDRKIARRTVRKALTAGSNMVLRAAKQLVPRDTGMLRLALGVSVKLKKDGLAIARVGPRTGYLRKRRGETTPRLSKLGKALAAAGVKPTKYGHLVEKGRKTGRPMAAQPFLGPALQREAPAAVAAMAAVIRKALDES